MFANTFVYLVLDYFLRIDEGGREGGGRDNENNLLGPIFNTSKQHLTDTDVLQFLITSNFHFNNPNKG